MEAPQVLSNGQHSVSQFQSVHDTHQRSPDSFCPTSRLRIGCCDINPPVNSSERYTRSYLDVVIRN
jgi:hypothetical protein